MDIDHPSAVLGMWTIVVGNNAQMTAIAQKVQQMESASIRRVQELNPPVSFLSIVCRASFCLPSSANRISACAAACAFFASARACTSDISTLTAAPIAPPPSVPVIVAASSGVIKHQFLLDLEISRLV